MWMTGRREGLVLDASWTCVQHTNAFIPGPRKPVPSTGESGSGA
jgi:hypothetical protein